MFHKRIVPEANFPPISSEFLNRLPPPAPQKKHKIALSKRFKEKVPVISDFEGALDERCQVIHIRKQNEEQFSTENLVLTGKFISLKMATHEIHLLVKDYNKDGISAQVSLWIDRQKIEGQYIIAINTVNPYSDEKHYFSITLLGIKNIQNFIENLCIHEENTSKVREIPTGIGFFQQAKIRKTSDDLHSQALDIELHPSIPDGSLATHLK